MKHFLTIENAKSENIQTILDKAYMLREERESGQLHEPILKGRTLAMLFEKPSLRTRVSFEQAMLELGGDAIVMAGSEVGIGKRETPQDMAAVLSGMVHGIMARVFEHEKLVGLAETSQIPVINALSDLCHPCQALADVMTMMDEFGRDLNGRTLTFVGDGNNVAYSLAWIAAALGFKFRLSSPKGYSLPGEVFGKIRAQYPGASLTAIEDPFEAVQTADAIYADTFVSMGQEEEKASRLETFKNYQVNEDLLSKAPDHAIILHCLPAYRGIEITDDVMDGPQSRVFPQAHNRLHAQKGLLATLLSSD